ncbi:hypothetical protein TNCV_423831 [Trichonephila clavipes]|nr:hypothetical protein TNCV_423831 [Trichonephila clavipes]
MEAVKQKTAELLKALTKEDFQHCFDQWKDNKVRETYRKLSEKLHYCETAIFTNPFINLSDQFVSHNARASTLLFLANKPKCKSEGRVRKNEEVRKEKKVRGMLLQPASSQPGLERGTVVLQENSITMRIIGEHKWMKVITQQLSVPNCMEIGTRIEDH